MIKQKNRILIVGGVAGGASCAARLRRLCESCEIVLFDKGQHVSFANCGLPYFVGNVIEDESKLVVATPELFNKQFNIKVKTEHEVTKIDRGNKTIQVKNLQTGEINEEHYDALVLATGSKAIRPPLTGIDLPGIYVLRTIPDSHKLRAATRNAKSAVIIGGGFIGLEMAENLVNIGLSVTLVEMADQVMPPLDIEMATYVEQCLLDNKVDIKLSHAVQAFTQTKSGLMLSCTNDVKIHTDMVLLAIGVQPESSLAKDAGLNLGGQGGIQVSDTMQTSDAAIWAVGDVIEVQDVVTGQVQSVPLAGPANRQGRTAAGAILESFNPGKRRHLSFRGVQSTAVCQVFGCSVAMTGASEKALQRAGIKNYQAVYLHPGHHVGYFPGASPIHLKLLFATDSGKILGVQAVGKQGVARRVDVIAMAIQMQATVYDLEESELCYAPQFGSAKDPVNMAGMIASNHLRGDLPLANWKAIDDKRHYILDVRNIQEYAAGHIPKAINMPLEELRSRVDELPHDKIIWLVCGVGQRAYYAIRLLMQHGYQAQILSGGMQTYQVMTRSNS